MQPEMPMTGLLSELPSIWYCFARCRQHCQLVLTRLRPVLTLKWSRVFSSCVYLVNVSANMSMVVDHKFRGKPVRPCVTVLPCSNGEKVLVRCLLPKLRLKASTLQITIFRPQHPALKPMHVSVERLRKPCDLALEPKLLICAILGVLARGEDNLTILMQHIPYP